MKSYLENIVGLLNRIEAEERAPVDAAAEAVADGEDARNRCGGVSALRRHGE